MLLFTLMDIVKGANQIKKEAQEKISELESLARLEDLYSKLLGKKGKLADLTKQIPDLAPEERPEAGKVLNQVKDELGSLFAEKKEELAKSEETGERVWIDVTLPGKKPEQGTLHPITQTIEEIEDIFHRLGFVRRRYREAESDWYAFESLNMPENHAARDEWETFYVESERGDVVLTPHTSNGQVRELERVGVPVRMINISRCDRRQADVSHIPSFYQFEGLVVDKGINITHLKGTLDYFVREYFGRGREYRLRPTDFRFTEPSFEIDITCILCDGAGCRACKAGWMELGGAGVVHPTVLKNGGVDPREYSGFAFGWGVERVFAMRSGVDDIRKLYDNNVRFLRQF